MIDLDQAQFIIDTLADRIQKDEIESNNKRLTVPYAYERKALKTMGM